MCKTLPHKNQTRKEKKNRKSLVGVVVFVVVPAPSFCPSSVRNPMPPCHHEMR
jgi:hypothetical protein